ncbi:MAG: hypothetical protein ACOWWR_07400 [Eubacteriales bacterium]
MEIKTSVYHVSLEEYKKAHPDIADIKAACKQIDEDEKSMIRFILSLFR